MDLRQLITCSPGLLSRWYSYIAECLRDGSMSLDAAHRPYSPSRMRRFLAAATSSDPESVQQALSVMLCRAIATGQSDVSNPPLEVDSASCSFNINPNQVDGSSDYAPSPPKLRSKKKKAIAAKHLGGLSSVVKEGSKRKVGSRGASSGQSARLDSGFEPLRTPLFAPSSSLNPAPKKSKIEYSCSSDGRRSPSIESGLQDSSPRGFSLDEVMTHHSTGQCASSAFYGMENSTIDSELTKRQKDLFRRRFNDTATCSALDPPEAWSLQDLHEDCKLCDYAKILQKKSKFQTYSLAEFRFIDDYHNELLSDGSAI